MDPPIDIVGHPAEHDEVFDGMQAGDRSPVGEAGLVVLSLVRVHPGLAPVHLSRPPRAGPSPPFAFTPGWP
eukprot:272769-Chlamydomonas_euryale.AAC.1